MTAVPVHQATTHGIRRRRRRRRRISPTPSVPLFPLSISRSHAHLTPLLFLLQLDNFKDNPILPIDPSSSTSSTSPSSSSSALDATSSLQPRVSQIKKSPGAHYDRTALGTAFEIAAGNHPNGQAFLKARDRVRSGEHLASSEKRAELEAAEPGFVEEVNKQILVLDGQRTREEILKDPGSVGEDGVRLVT